jgi:hypothetical protein
MAFRVLTLLAVLGVQLLIVVAAAAEVPQPAALEQPQLSIARKLLQPFTLGLPPITRASDSAGTINERSVINAGFNQEGCGTLEWDEQCRGRRLRQPLRHMY